MSVRDLIDSTTSSTHENLTVILQLVSPMKATPTV